MVVFAECPAGTYERVTIDPLHVSAELITCSGWTLNKAPEVKDWIVNEYPKYDHKMKKGPAVSLTYVGGEEPTLYFTQYYMLGCFDDETEVKSMMSERHLQEINVKEYTSQEIDEKLKEYDIIKKSKWYKPELWNLNGKNERKNENFWEKRYLKGWNEWFYAFFFI